MSFKTHLFCSFNYMYSTVFGGAAIAQSRSRYLWSVWGEVKVAVNSPCLTHLSRTGSLLCLTTAWTSLVVSPATGVSLTSSRSSSWLSLPPWHAALPGRSSPTTGNCPFSAPPFSSSPSSPSSFLLRTLSWALLVQWFFLFFRLLDMARGTEGVGREEGAVYMGAAVGEVLVAVFKFKNNCAEFQRWVVSMSASGGSSSGCSNWELPNLWRLHCRSKT